MLDQYYTGINLLNKRGKEKTGRKSLGCQKMFSSLASSPILSTV